MGIQHPAASAVDNDDEWEYEYSTTETETYYVTLDLSVRDFIDKIPEDSAVHSTRASYRTTWRSTITKNSNQEGDEQALAKARSSETNGEGDGDDDDDEDEDESRDLLSEAVRRKRLEAPVKTATTVHNKEGQKGSEPILDKLQVMDLHSPNPLLSYRGMVFRGSWAENIGTEMIFMPHEQDAKLPILRQVPGDIDLVAASSARINFKQVQLEIKGGEPQKMSDWEWAEAADRRYRENGGLYVHVGSDKHGYRRPQANFLEDFEALKRKRGEMEGVTIVTHETERTELIRNDFDEEQRRKKQLRDRGRNRNRALLQAALKRGNAGRRRTGRSKGRGPPRGPMRSRVRQAAEAELRPLEGTPPAWQALSTIAENELDKASTHR